MAGIVRSIGITLEMIKWEHSIFALPFALTATLLAAGGLPPLRALLWILVAMVAARSSAMAFNRWADARLDAANPRTKMRALPAGLLSSGFVFGFTVITALIFLLAAYELNFLTLCLSPIVLVVLFGYSYLKRFTPFAHLGLGLALGLAPSAAWIAVRGSLDARIVLLTAAVMFWVAGFDILYACQDFEHDRAVGLYSIPAKLGLERAFLAARIFHCGVILLLLLLAVDFHFGWPGFAGVAAVALLLGYEHALVSPCDLTKLNAAFFTMNGVIAMVFFAFVGLDLWVKR